MTTPAQVADVLRDRILSLHYPAGSPLREIAIAAESAASRRTVREALLMLDREGIVVHERNRGARVRAFSPDDVGELYEVRRALETYGAQHAATASDDRVAAVTRAFDRLSASAHADQDSLRHAVDDMAFHASVIALAGSTKLDEIFATISVEMALAIRVLQHDEVDERMSADDVVAEHARIRDAVVARRPDEAVDAVRQHIDENNARLVRLSTPSA